MAHSENGLGAFHFEWSRNERVCPLLTLSILVLSKVSFLADK